MKDRLLEKRNPDMQQIILLVLLGVSLCVVGSVVSIDIAANEVDNETLALFLVTMLNSIIFGAYATEFYLSIINGNTTDG